MAALVPTPGLSAGWRQIIVNGALLPLNYVLEFGVFFLVGGAMLLFVDEKRGRAAARLPVL